MFLLSLFRVSNFFISDYNPTILDFFRISIHIKYFSSSYVTCTSQNNDTDDKSRKRKINELEEESNEIIKFKLNESKEEELKSTRDIKNNKIKCLSSSFSLFQEPEVYSENSSESYQLEAFDL